jgi:hypothetical protein
MRQTFALATLVLGLCMCSRPSLEIQTPSEEFRKHLKTVDDIRNRPEVENHNKWIAKILGETESIKSGMTRRELLQIFTTDGGLSARTRQTYSHRECPFKVDVTFGPVGREAPMYGSESMGPRGDDVIASISVPYLARPRAD